ncbi:hypothetical protein GCM10011321_00660 [Youhaiella tibetensis]|nr:hypothetical protein [Youhaiella tibetensis]GGF12446.1 hypothetical protein GCM10011321_00660 [Youhaiella tibetensis]
MYDTNPIRRGATALATQEDTRRARLMVLMAAIIPAAAILVACATMLAAI